MPKYGQPFAYSFVQTLFLQTSIHVPQFTNYSNKYVVLFHGYDSCKNDILDTKVKTLTKHF